MKRQRSSLRLAIRIMQVRLVLTGQRQLARFLNRALYDRDILDEVVARSTSGLAIGDGALLDWFLENWETILEIILTIIGLFASKSERVEILKIHKFSVDIESYWAITDAPVALAS